MTKPFVVFSSASAQALAVGQTAVNQGLEVRAVLRGDKASTIKGPHEVFRADLTIVDSLVRAMSGVRAAFFHIPIASSPDQAAIHLSNFLFAAKQAQLPLLIFSSSSFADDSFSSTPLIDGNRFAVQQVLASGLPSIVLKPGLYLENLLVPFFVPNLEQGVLDYPPMNPDQAMSWTSHWDQALLAVAALQKPNLIGKAYNIASSKALTPTELATLLGKQRGNPAVKFQAINPEQFAQRVAIALNNPSLNFLLADLYRSINAQNPANLVVNTETLEKEFGVRLQSVSKRIGAWSLSGLI
jgi:uncharacterized protein YbjT (DUF2867 family)